MIFRYYASLFFSSVAVLCFQKMPHLGRKPLSQNERPIICRLLPQLSYRQIIVYFLLMFGTLSLFGQNEARDSTALAGNQGRDLPNNTSVFLVPTGFGMDQGEIYYQNYSLLFNQIHFGASEEFSLGFTFEWLSLLTSLDSIDTYAPGFVITPKVSIPVIEDELQLGLGAFFAEIPNTDAFIDLAFVLGTATYGTEDKNISLGFGFGLIEGEFAALPTVFLSGQYRFSNRLAVIGESGIIPGPNLGFSNLAMRLIGRKLHWDLGLITIGAKGEVTQSIPLVGLVVPLRRGRQ